MDRKKIIQAINDLDLAGEGAEVKYFDEQRQVTLWRQDGLLLCCLVEGPDERLDIGAMRQVNQIARELNCAYRQPDRLGGIPG